MASEEQERIERALRNQFEQGRISRRQFIQHMLGVGMGLGGIAVLGGCGPAAGGPPTAVPTTAPAAAAPTTAPAAAATTAPAAAAGRPLTPSFYQWIEDLHPAIKGTVNPKFPDVNYQIAPVQGYDISRFVAEGRQGQSTWDVYVGMTPFVEMRQFIEAGVIEPWDPYIPKEVLDDIIPSIREECTVDGQLWSWPFLLDVIVEAQNNSLVSAAGLPDKIPADWDEYLASAKTIIDSGAAPYGCTFDANGWRSLAPITHSFSTDAYYNVEGDKSGIPLFDFTSEPALEAIQIMKQMLDLSSANALQPGATDAGVNQTPDEIAFSRESVAYYVKYQNAPLRFKEFWKDKGAFRMGALPKGRGGEGSTAFWTTGACLFKHGQNKEKAAEYMRALTYEPQVWRDSITGTASGHPGQLPPYKSVNDDLARENPDWLQAQTWVPLVRAQLDVAKAIPAHAFGLTQFQIAKPFWEKYLTGEEQDPKAAMQAAKDAVVAEMRKTGAL